MREISLYPVGFKLLKKSFKAAGFTHRQGSGFLLQRVGAEFHLLVKYGVDFRLGNIASRLTENSGLDFSNRL